MMKKAKGFVAVLLCFVLVALMAACGGGSASGGSQAASADGGASTAAAGGGDAGGTEDTSRPIVIANKADIKTLDPHAVNEVIHSRPTRHIFSKLVRLDSSMEYVPDLAESWEYESDTVLVFKLREGVKWHDGTDFKASDVIFSFDRQRESAAAKYLLDPVTSYSAPDDYTIRIELEKPYAPIMANLAHVCSAIVPEKAVTEMGDDFALNPVGTGSMKFVEMVSGDRVVLTRNEDYFGEMAKAPGLIFKCMPEESARSIALETGEIDMDPELSYQSIARVEEDTSLELYEWSSIFVEYLLLNVTKAPLDNQLVRQAIAHVVDRQAVVDVVLEGHGRATDTVLPMGVLGYTEDYPKYDLDVETAKDLLAQAGYPDGFDLTINVSSTQMEREATIIQANLAQIGINATVELMERNAILEAYANNSIQCSVESWGNGTGDPEGTLFVSFYSEQKGAGGNRTWYENAEVDTALLAGRETVDPDARAEAYGEATRLIMEDVPWVPLYNRSFVVGCRAGLMGIDEHPTGYDAYDMLHYE